MCKGEHCSYHVLCILYLMCWVYANVLCSLYLIGHMLSVCYVRISYLHMSHQSQVVQQDDNGNYPGYRFWTFHGCTRGSGWEDSGVCLRSICLSLARSWWQASALHPVLANHIKSVHVQYTCSLLVLIATRIYRIFFGLLLDGGVCSFYYLAFNWLTRMLWLHSSTCSVQWPFLDWKG